MDWKECCDTQLAKDVKPDQEMIKSLIKSSKNKIESENKLPMSDVTAASKLSLAYDSIRELLEALALKNGYKIYNHECYTAFLKEVLRKSFDGDEFDDIRRVRNAANYYEKELSIVEANDIIKRIRNLRARVTKLLEM